MARTFMATVNRKTNELAYLSHADAEEVYKYSSISKQIIPLANKARIMHSRGHFQKPQTSCPWQCI